MRLRNRLCSTTMLLTAATALLLLATTGCGGFEGESGNLGFNFETDEFASKKPLAVNGTVLIHTHLEEGFSGGTDAGMSSDTTEQTVEVTSVTSSDTSIISVEQVGEQDPNSFTLKGQAAGTVDIDVEVSTEDGSTVSDGFSMEAVEVDRVELSHPCGDDEENSKPPVYLTDQTVAVNKTLYGTGDEALTGRGYNPVDVSGPNGTAQLADPANDANLLNVATGDTAGTVTLSPTVNGEDLELEVKKESSIDGLEWYSGNGQEPGLLEIDEENNKGWLIPLFDAGDRRVCKGDVDLTIDNKTSSVCSVSTETLDNPGELLAEYTNLRTVVAVTAKKEETCKFDVSVSSASSATVSAEIDVSSLMD